MQVFGFDAIQPYFMLFLLIFVNLSFFKWIEKHRKEHKKHENTYRVKKLKASQSIMVDNNSPAKILPSAPSISSIFSGSKQIGYMERIDMNPEKQEELDKQMEDVYKEKEMMEKKANLRRTTSYVAPSKDELKLLDEESSESEKTENPKNSTMDV